MAEIMGVLSLAAALPAVAVAVAQIGKYLLTQLKAVKDHSEDMEEFRKFAPDLYNGQMKIYWDTAGTAYASKETDAAMKQSLEDSWADMQCIFSKIEKQVQRFADMRIMRMWTSRKRAAGSRRLVQELKQRKIEFHAYLA